MWQWLQYSQHNLHPSRESAFIYNLSYNGPLVPSLINENIYNINFLKDFLEIMHAYNKHVMTDILLCFTKKIIKNGRSKNSYSSVSNDGKHFSSFKLMFKYLKVESARMLYDHFSL